MAIAKGCPTAVESMMPSQIAPPLRIPNLNAHTGRFIESMRTVCLDMFPINALR